MTTVNNDNVYSNLVLFSLHEMQKANSMCDIELMAENRSIKAHKVVLCAVSPYFRTMFQSDLQNKTDKKIVLQNMTYGTLVNIISAFYTGSIMINEENYVEIMDVINYMHLDHLRIILNNFMVQYATTKNPLEMLAYAKYYSYEDVAEEIISHIIANFNEIVNRESFQNVPADLLTSIFFHNLLDTEQVFFCIQQWMEQNSSNYMTFPKANINMSLKNYIAKLNEFKQKEKKYEGFITAVIKLFEHRFIDKESDMTVDSSKQKRIGTQVIFTIGGLCNDALSSVECWHDNTISMMLPFDGISNESLTGDIIPQMENRRMLVTAASKKNKIYVIGGCDRLDELDTCECYNSRTNTWNFEAPLPFTLYGAAACFVDGILHVIGGCTKNTSNVALIFDEIKSTWKTAPHMFLEGKIYHHSMCSVRGTLYVLGGKDDEKCSEMIYRYNRSLKLWLRVRDMPYACINFGCVSYKHYIYIFGGKCGENIVKSVYRYDTLLDNWTRKSDMPVPKASFGCVLMNHKVYCIGGIDTVHGPLACMQVYHLQTNRWHCLPTRLKIARAQEASVLLEIEHSSKINNESCKN